MLWITCLPGLFDERDDGPVSVLFFCEIKQVVGFLDDGLPVFANGWSVNDNNDGAQGR